MPFSNEELQKKLERIGYATGIQYSLMVRSISLHDPTRSDTWEVVVLTVYSVSYFHINTAGFASVFALCWQTESLYIFVVLFWRLLWVNNLHRFVI
jgi:hypothetical protein